jgi:hypothetical protein
MGAKMGRTIEKVDSVVATIDTNNGPNCSYEWQRSTFGMADGQVPDVLGEFGSGKLLL